MDKNKFEIDIVTQIPEEKVPGKVYINGTKYANVMPEELPETFLITDEPIEETGYLGCGVHKEVIACVGAESVPNDKIFVTVRHPGYTIPIPEDPTRYYLDSKGYNLYKPVENPRINGYRELEYAGELFVVYQDTTDGPNIYVYSDDGAEDTCVTVIYEVLEELNDWSEEEEANKRPASMFVVKSLEEMYEQEPGFLAIYKVIKEDGTFVTYIYNPYDLVEQDYFNFNVDALY